MANSRYPSRHLEMNRVHGLHVCVKPRRKVLHAWVLSTTGKQVHVGRQVLLIVTASPDVITDSLSLFTTLILDDLVVSVDRIPQMH